MKLKFNKPIIVAEIGWNFLGDMKLAKKMIKNAKKSGADAVKFQLWNPRNLKKGPHGIMMVEKNYIGNLI